MDPAHLFRGNSQVSAQGAVIHSDVPWRLAPTTALQYTGNLSDRRAANAVEAGRELLRDKR